MAVIEFALYRRTGPDNDRSALLERVAPSIYVEDAPGGVNLNNADLAEAVANSWLATLQRGDDEKRTGHFVAVRVSRLLPVRITADRIYTVEGGGT